MLVNQFNVLYLVKRHTRLGLPHPTTYYTLPTIVVQWEFHKVGNIPKTLIFRISFSKWAGTWEPEYSVNGANAYYGSFQKEEPNVWEHWLYVTLKDKSMVFGTGK